MVDRFRTLLTHFAVRWLPGPRSLLLAAWQWLAAEADDLGKKRRCIEAILRLDPDSEWAYTACLWVVQEQTRPVSQAEAHRENLVDESLNP